MPKFMVWRPALGEDSHSWAEVFEADGYEHAAVKRADADGYSDGFETFVVAPCDDRLNLTGDIKRVQVKIEILYSAEVIK